MSLSIEEDLALATTVVTVAEKALAAYKAAKAGDISPSKALAHIEAMLRAIPSEFADDDARAEDALNEKFG